VQLRVQAGTAGSPHRHSLPAARGTPAKPYCGTVRGGDRKKYLAGDANAV